MKIRHPIQDDLNPNKTFTRRYRVIQVIGEWFLVMAVCAPFVYYNRSPWVILFIAFLWTAFVDVMCDALCYPRGIGVREEMKK